MLWVDAASSAGVDWLAAPSRSVARAFYDQILESLAGEDRSIPC